MEVKRELGVTRSNALCRSKFQLVLQTKDETSETDVSYSSVSSDDGTIRDL